MPPRSAVRAKGLTKHFGPVRAVESLDLTVRTGEVFGYLGPNGAGKTTTIRLMLDFIRPTSGEVSVLGSRPRDHETRRRIGYLPGELALDPRYTPRDVFEFYGKLRGGVDWPVVEALAARFDLDIGRRIGQLSTGNKRKVGVVQAFMHRPELLVLDEPTSGLDPLLQHEFHELVRETSGEGATVFLSSHALAEVEDLAERVAILRRGRLVKVARVDELRRTARQHIDLYFDRRVDAKPFARLPEVVEATAADGLVRLVVSGRVEGVLRTAARLHARRIVSPEAELEQVFLDLYREPT
ncbi:MAG TPA: ABC transporter ATP-binding protein [Actinomycetota bacterium]|nr:ABC transporter ATP-binding protein [Actinomycetota bacterium]